MSKSKVYFTDFHVPVGTSQLEKLRRLIDRAGLGEMDLNNKFVCIKMHWRAGKFDFSAAQLCQSGG